MSFDDFNLAEIEYEPATELFGLEHKKAAKNEAATKKPDDMLGDIIKSAVEKYGAFKKDNSVIPADLQSQGKWTRKAGQPVFAVYNDSNELIQVWFVFMKNGKLNGDAITITNVKNEWITLRAKQLKAEAKQAKADAKTAKKAEKEGASEGLLDMLDDMDVATELFGLGKHEKTAKAEAETKEQKDLIDELIKATASQYGGLLKNEEGLPGKKIPEGKWMRRAGQPVYVVSNEDGTPKIIYMVFDAGHGPEYDDINVANVTKEWVRMRTKQLKAEAKANKQAEKAAKKAAKNGDVEGATEALISMIELYTDMDLSDDE